MKLSEYEDQLEKIAYELAGYLIKTGASQEDAWDIAQDTFVKLLETELIIPYPKLKSWMYRVAISQFIDRYRRNKRYQELLTLYFHDEKTWEVPFEQKEELLLGLSKLKIETSALLLLKYEQGFSIKEIAQLLDVSESKVKVDLHRARKQLKKELTHNDSTEEDV